MTTAPDKTSIQFQEGVAVDPNPIHLQRDLSEIEIKEGVPVDPDLIRPNLDHIVTEDNTPVDNLFSEKQQRLLTEPLFSSWNGPGEGRPFVAMANVGLFYGSSLPPLVPDTLVSLDVTFPEELWEKHHRSYFIWEYGKPPELAIEVVSNRIGGELTRKHALYAQIGVLYYVVFDPDQRLGGSKLQVFELARREYTQREQAWFPELGLGLCLWQGHYEQANDHWLRWCYADGSLVPTGAELAGQAQAQAEQAQAQVEQERARVERLIEQLRALGIEPAV